MVLSAAYRQINYSNPGTSWPNAYELALQTATDKRKSDFYKHAWDLHQNSITESMLFCIIFIPGPYTPFGEASLVESIFWKREQV
jgi:hypothetical protein